MTFSTLLECGHCRNPFQPTNKRQRFCTSNCRAKAAYLPTKLLNREKKEARFKARNRAKSLGFDGRHSGPENKTGGFPLIWKKS